jgi:serine/threonine protein phosphatase PrpC
MGKSEFGAGTHAGRVREHNEDYYAVDSQTGLWLIADGMGGRAAGEIASATVAESILRSVRQGASAVEAVTTAHQAVIDVLNAGRGAPGMGSTAVVLIMRGDNYEIAWVGDSRAYLWSGKRKELRQLTRDHTVVQALVDAKLINAQEARVHPQRNRLTTALGASDLSRLEVGSVSGKLHPGEQVLLCSDGLTSELDDEQVAAILGKNLDAQKKVDRLIRAALESGGHDNITVLLIHARGETAELTDEETQPLFKDVDTQPLNLVCVTPSSSNRWTGMGMWLIPLLMIGLALLIWWWQGTTG